MKGASQRGKGPIELVEEAFHLLRLQPISALAAYYIGAAPFVLGMLFFWSDMSRGTYAESRLAAETAGLTLLFFWMKTWQALFVRQLRSQLIDHTAAPVGLKGFCRITVTQAILQPSGLFLIPIAVLLLFPLGWVYAFYQNVTVLGASDDYEFKDIYRKALKQSAAWPLQNHYVIVLFSLFSFFVLLNIFSGLVLIPHLLSMLLGIQTAFVQSAATFMNTTFFAAVCGLTYLCVDPLVKAVYLLRCFYGESRQSGEDLKAELRRFSNGLLKAATLILACGLFLGVNALSSPNDQLPIANYQLPIHLNLVADSPSPRKGLEAEQPEEDVQPAKAPSASAPARADELDHTIEQVLQRPEYTWRLPREKVAEQKEKGKIAAFIEGIYDKVTGWAKKIARAIDRFITWLSRSQTSPTAKPTPVLSWLFSARGLMVFVILLIAALLGLLLLRLWKDREPDAQEVAAEAIVPTPNLDDENIAADQLPEDGWITLARDLLGRGELRLALRAFYLASLAHLAQRNLITIARFKSNRDYERELSRRAHALPEVMSTFSTNVSTFDRIWYGLHEVNQPLVDQFRTNVEKINTT